MFALKCEVQEHQTYAHDELTKHDTAHIMIWRADYHLKWVLEDRLVSGIP